VTSAYLLPPDDESAASAISATAGASSIEMTINTSVEAGAALGIETIDVRTGQSIDAAQLPARARARAVLYLRVSTLGQVQTDYDPEGNSIPAQREAGQRKAVALNADIIREFVEPGKSALDIDRRPAFQEMIAWVKNQGDIDYIIVYNFQRVFRNSVDAGVIKRDLKKYGTRIVSTVIDMGVSPEANLVESIIHAVDQYQSEASGADIKYKMRAKIQKGGSVGLAKLGYLNVREPKPGGGEIRTVAVDTERAPFVRLAFELYATGDWGVEDLADELYDRGLRTRATPKRPAQKVSVNKLWNMLSDRYYLGYVIFDGEEIPGRHEALIDPDLFDRVQDVLDLRGTAGERRRTHHHYLKGTLFCGRCHRAGRIGRMILQPVTNSRGTEYLYFFCRNTQKHLCDAPYINVQRIEPAVEDHYARIRFTPAFITTVRADIDQTIADQERSTRLLHQQLTTELRALDAQENNLIDLAATTPSDLTAAKTKIHAKLREIEQQRHHLS
jgi:site-specific DNA recombinase